MITRPLFLVVGVGIGVAIGVWTVRRVDRATQALAPGHVAARAGQSAGALGERLSDAIAAGRVAAAEKEAELRAVYRTRPAPPDAV